MPADLALALCADLAMGPGTAAMPNYVYRAVPGDGGYVVYRYVLTRPY